MKSTVKTGPKRRRWKRRDQPYFRRSRHVGGLGNDPFPYSPRKCLVARHRHTEVITPQVTDLFGDDHDEQDEALLTHYVDEQEEAYLYSLYDYLDDMLDTEYDPWLYEDVEGYDEPADYHDYIDLDFNPSYY